METHHGKSVPVVKEFQIEGSWGPATPLKPIQPRPRSAYEDGTEGLFSQTQAIYRESEEYPSRYSHPNQAQTLVSCSISSAERSSIPNNHHIYPDNNHLIWETHNRVESQRRGLEEHLHPWPSHGKRTTPSSLGSSSYPNFSSWNMQSPWSNNNNGMRDNVSMLQNNLNDSLLDSRMKFAELLAMNDSAVGPPMVSSRLGDSGGAATSSVYPWWDQPEDTRLDSSSAVRYLEALHEHQQQINGIQGQEMQNSAFLQQGWTFTNISSPPSTKHASAKNFNFAPMTPDTQRRADSTVASGPADLDTQQKPDEQNQLQEHEAAAVMVNLQSHNNKAVMGPSIDSSPGKGSTAVAEHNPDKGIDLNKTPQKKPRRRRYQPKVVNENKPKRTPKPKTPKPTESKEAPKTKRKYVRKNKVEKPSTDSPASETITVDPKPTQQASKSCRRSLNFDLNGQVTDPPNDCHTSENQSIHTVDTGQGEKLGIETSRVGIAYDLNQTLNQEKNYMSLPEEDILNKEREKAANCIFSNGNEESSKTEQAQSPNSSPCASSNEGVQTRGSKRVHSSMTDTTNVDAGNMAATDCSFWQTNHIIMSNADIPGVPRSPFPEKIYKKKRTDKGQRSHTSSTSSSVTASEDVGQTRTQNHPTYPATSKYYYGDLSLFGTNGVTNTQVELLMKSTQNRVHLNSWPDMSRLKKKRSKGTTRVRDLAPLEGIASAKPPCGRSSDLSCVPYGNLNYIHQSIKVHSCMEPSTDDTHETSRLKRRNRKGVAQSRTTKEKNGWDLVLYDAKRSKRNTSGSTRRPPLVKTLSVEAITNGLKRLDINRESSRISYQQQKALVPYSARKQEQNALVLYKNDGTVVPFEGSFDPVKKRRQRAKVDLDDETSRVWRLLLENIDNEGIDGTDEQKAKWWENERTVFRGRVDSFIARMRLVQGDRRFTPWKGSVLDSVVGVFLTQNVSDHLSSSAFMCLAARFPIKLESSDGAVSEEATSPLAVEPQIFVIEPEESITWHEKPMDQPTCDRNSRIIHEIDLSEEKEITNCKEMSRGFPDSVTPVDYSCESSQKAPNDSRVDKANSHTTETEAASIIGDERARDDATSQQSVISSQNSASSPQAFGMMNIFSENNSRAQALASSSHSHSFDPNSFLGLLQSFESPFLHDLFSQIRGRDQPDFIKHVRKDSPDALDISSSDYQLHQKSDFHLKATTCIDMVEVESKPPDTSRKDENSPAEQSNLTTESTLQAFVQEKDCSPRSSPENVSSCYVLEGERMVIQSQRQSRKDSPDHVASSTQGQTSSNWKSPKLQNLSQETADITESTTALDRTNNEHKEVAQISEHNYTSGGNSLANANPAKPKKGKVGKDKRNAYDWDSLRKQAQVNGIKKERPAHTRDSVDWEAVRHADVSVLAETIKERGMNNMLAERIKDLLDRLVKEHGSTDLEWLRDIPPDKAKEYLLSFRGLGLKSVECVRLLTLHHLAFPVDTNVGRIAVRLGWVPLQPLPESLQLHLLELYPILESIQKYLWPRLCKLDQKTLYELHYHMITFGKVFCTKRQPNCNACPLRGECRHFASAFASARLSLPGPEERSIVASNGGSSIHVDSGINVHPLPLPPPSDNHQPEASFGCNKDVSVIEVPSTPLSLSLPQTAHHLERRSQVNCEPIVEVPASPEPEPEQEQTLCDIEDALYEDPNVIPTIELNLKEFTQTIQNVVQANRELQESGISRALVALTAEAASIPMPKLKNISRLRTEHHVYELPDTHPLLQGLDKREPDDPCSYLLAIWTPGETADSIQPPERRCSSGDPDVLCNEETCSYCNSQREANSQVVRGTLLIPCRTAMRGSFPLNGTYFQVNEVFADHDSSLNPIQVPRHWLWNLSRRTVYFGTSIPTLFRGMTTEDIQHCFWRGYVCVRGFDQKTRAPRPLMARLHFPASKLQRGARGKPNDE